jgi:hypothetical protein
MKKAFYLLVGIGGMLICLSVLAKEFHFSGRKAIEVSGIIALLIAMIVFIVASLTNKNLK